MKQRSKEWHQARTGKITGSRVPGILGLSPWTTAQNVLREMILQSQGKPPEFKGNVATKWGEDHENDGINWYEERTGNLVQEHGILVHPEYDWMGYSPDGTTGDALIEVKCPYSKKIPDEIPDHYQAQVQFGMEVMGLEKCHFIYWTPNQQSCMELERDPAWFAKVMPTLQDFYESYQEALKDPEKYLEPPVFERTDTNFKEKVDAYLRAKRQSEKVSEALAFAKEELIEASEGKNTVGFGLRVTHVTSKGRPDYSGFFKNHPELKDEVETGPASSSVRITLEKSDAKSLRYSR